MIDGGFKIEKYKENQKIMHILNRQLETSNDYDQKQLSELHTEKTQLPKKRKTEINQQN